MITIKHLSVSAGMTNILADISLSFKTGKTYAILGPNGSGKSTLGHALLGHPSLTIARGGAILLGTRNITRLAPDKRAKLGLALSFQNPLPLPGISVRDLLRIALEKQYDPVVLHRLITDRAKELRIKDELLTRSLNDGFSGGEKKKLEALQISLLDPRFVLFDEIDTGVDIDALKHITRFLRKYLSPRATLVFITHSAKLLAAVKPDTVIVMKNGRIVREGGPALAALIERKGFDHLA